MKSELDAPNGPECCIPRLQPNGLLAPHEGRTCVTAQWPQVVTHAAQPVSGMRAATFALAELELARDVGASGTMSDAAVAAAATYGGNAVRTPPMSPAPKQHAHHGHQAAHSSHAGSGSAHAGAGSGSSSSSSSGRSHGATGSHASEADVGRGPPRGSSEHTPRPHAVEHAHHAHARSDHNRQQGHPHDHQQHHHAHEQQQQQEQVQQPGPGLAGAQASSQAPPRRSRRILPIDIPLQLPGLAGKQAAELQAVMSKWVLFCRAAHPITYAPHFMPQYLHVHFPHPGWGAAC